MNKGLWALLGLMGLGLVGIVIEGVARPRFIRGEMTGGTPLSSQELQLVCFELNMIMLADVPMAMWEGPATNGKCHDETLPKPVAELLPLCEHQGEGLYTCPPNTMLEAWWRDKNGLPPLLLEPQ